MGINKAIKCIRDKRYKRFLISAHKNLEGDAIGSMLAMAELLKQAGKKVILFPPEDIPAMYKFLPGSAGIKLRSRIEGIDYDVACLLDCTGIERIGDIKAGICLKKPILNIDHHISNTYFGSINWVEPGMSCSGEQVYHIFKKMGIPINKRAALYIYIAILTDTGSFRYSNTTPDTHRIVAELMQHGIDAIDIYRKIYEQTTLSSLSLLASALSTLNTAKGGEIAWVHVSRAMFNKYRVSVEDTQELVNFPRMIKGVKIALAFREVRKGLVKVSFRSNGVADVNKLAKHFNGGGHAAASGCVLKGTIPKVEKAVVSRAKKFLGNGK